jgi:anti-anti-sigma factor
MSTKHSSRWLEREDFGDVTVVRVRAPRLGDDEITREIFDQIDTLVSVVGRRHLVLNLGAAEYLPSLALGKLVLLNRRAQAAGGRLALCHLSAAAGESLEATHLASLFHIYDTEQAALGSFPTTGSG